jgi:hypothetical protein
LEEVKAMRSECLLFLLLFGFAIAAGGSWPRRRSSSTRPGGPEAAEAPRARGYAAPGREAAGAEARSESAAVESGPRVV